MGLFSKESGVDIIDLPDLHRRKLIKLPKIEESIELKQGHFTKDGFFDLSNAKPPIQANQTSQEQNNFQISNQSDNQVTDFLSDFASIGASNPNKIPETNQQTQSQTPTNKESENIADLKWRIENLEFKLEQMMERLNSLNR
ncbi:hypothetical protein J4423_00150 [Candidatus Pacearchaeota archaeon]|nr:hypothetical protein [Candidatus Pacearchaeota archaeon]